VIEELIEKGLVVKVQYGDSTYLVRSFRR